MIKKKLGRNESKRLRALELASQDMCRAEIARQLGVTSRTVFKWLARGTGPQAVLQSSGRPAKLSDQQKEKLLEVLEAGALAYGFEVDLWTGPRIAYVIRQEFDVRLHPRWVTQMLHQLGWSRQKPRRKARERDEEKIQSWLEHEWPRLRDRRRPRAQR